MRLFRQPLPVVAAVQGAAVGGGLGLACAADFRVATFESRFDANFTRLGVHPGFGLSVILPRIVGFQNALGLLMEGRRLSGEQAKAIGLADQLVAQDELINAAVDLATEIANRAPLAVRAVRDTLRRSFIEDVENMLTWELSEQKRLWATEDSEIGIAATQNRTKPEFLGR